MLNKIGVVSIVVPVYNERRYLKECIDSIINQTYKNLEIVLVDDGSTDGTSKDCDFFQMTDKRIKVIHKKNEGLSAARITGLENVTGEWIFFMDDDDVISPYTIETLVFQFSEDIDIVSAGRIDKEDGDYNWKKPIGIDKIKLSGNEVVELIPKDKQKTIITPLWGKIYRTDFLKSIDLLQFKKECPTIFFEDVLMTPIIFSKAKTICVVKEKLYLHREVKTSISRSAKLSSFYYEQIYSGNFLLEYSKRNNLMSYYKYQLKIYINSILRIYILAEGEYFNKYEDSIIKYYNMYLKDYIWISDEPSIKKIIFLCFKYNPVQWRRLCRRLYFIKKEMIRG